LRLAHPAVKPETASTAATATQRFITSPAYRGRDFSPTGRPP